MKKILCFLLSVVLLLCFAAPVHAVTFDPPFPPFTLFAEQYPAALLYLLQQSTGLDMQFEPLQQNVTAELILEMLQDEQCKVDIIFLETNMEGYSTILESGLCENLSGASYLIEHLEQMPSIVSSPCCHNGILYAVPVSLNPSAGSSITCYNDLVNLTTLPDDISLTVAILNPGSPNNSRSFILLDALLQNCDSYTQALFFPPTP